MKTFVRSISVGIAAGLLLFAGPVVAQEDDDSEDKEESAAEASAELVLNEIKTATDVEDREATGESESFDKEDKVLIWMSFKNPEGEKQAKLVWKYDGNEVDEMDIDVGKSYRWRTWAKRMVTQEGDWEVEVRDQDDNKLDSVAFTVR